MTDESLFAAAWAITNPVERAALLDWACAGDAGRRRKIEERLAVPAELTGPFEPAEEPDDGAVAVGDHIGPYRLMEQIGEGGFGLVFVAEQSEPVRRKVALKVLKPGMDTRSVVARFEAERQALALMDHPNIARVFDGGRTKYGRPYFVMELVRGLPITSFCDQQRLSPESRLQLFMLVCQAVQHAHTKGVIHRDIKPGNVLVTMIDGAPVPKVIDFGIAKAVGQQLTDKTIYTRFAQMIGTPLYMSPEQAELSGVDVDTRTDVYALGVLLYELLTGSTPFDKERFRKAAYDEIRRIIREEEPPRPSTRLAKLRSSESATRKNQTPSGSGKSASIPHSELRIPNFHELDWIVMRCLEKDRNRRYETATGLARDVGRFLAGEAVEACPPTVGYRMRKLLRRHKGRVVTGALVMLTLVGGIIGTSWQAVIARRRANDLADESAKVRDQEKQTKVALSQVEESRRNSELILVRSLLRPLGQQTGNDRRLMPYSREQQLETAEVLSLLDIAALPEDRLRLLCLREAFADTPTAVRVASLAPNFIQAVVGSGVARRQEALAFVTAIRQDATVEEPARYAARRMAVELYSDDWSGYEDDLRHLAKRPSVEWIQFISPALIERAGPDRLGLLADALLSHGLTGRFAMNYSSLRMGDLMRLILPKLDKATCERMTDSLARHLWQDRLGTGDDELAKLVPEFARRTDRDRASRLLEERLAVKTDPRWVSDARLAAMTALAWRADRRFPEELAEIALAKLEKTKTFGSESEEAVNLLSVALRDADERLAANVARFLFLRMETATPRVEPFGFGRTDYGKPLRIFAACAARLAPADAGQLAREYLQQPKNITGDSERRRFTLSVLRALLPQAGKLTAGDLWEQVAEWITSGPIIEYDGAVGTAEDWAALVEHMPPDVAGRMLVALLPEEDETAFSKKDAGSILKLITPRLSRPVLLKLADVQVAMMRADPSYPDAVKLERTLHWLPESEAGPRRRAAFEAVMAALPTISDLSLGQTITALGELLRAMPAEERDAGRRRVVEAFLRIVRPILRDPTGANAERFQTELYSAFGAIRPLLDQAGAGELGALLLAVVGDPGVGKSAWSLLTDMASQLDRKTARAVMAEGVRFMLTAKPASLQFRGDYMFDVIPRLDPVADADVLEDSCRQLAGLLRSTKERSFTIGRVVVALADRLGNGRRDADVLLVVRQELDLAAKLQYVPGRGRFVEVKQDTLTMAIQVMTDPRQLAEALDHPACTGIARDLLLGRLDELCFPAPPAEQLRFAISPLGAAPVWTGLLAQAKHREDNRRFRAPWDAIEWLEQHPNR